MHHIAQLTALMEAFHRLLIRQPHLLGANTDDKLYNAARLAAREAMRS
jgi:hypothetical protein